MGQLTPGFFFNLEKKMKHISNNEYQRLLSNLWWHHVAKSMPTAGASEVITWLLNTAKIERPNNAVGGGQQIFEDILMSQTEFTVENAVGGLQLKKEKLEDIGANGVQLAAEWAKNMGAYAAYWPQKELAAAIRNNPTTYDQQPMFSSAHPLNPFKASYGVYSNDMTGAASGSYPGAVPVGGATTVEDALENLSKVIAYAAGIKMPNGEDPRMLRLSKILHPPALTSRFAQLTGSKFIAQSAAAGAGAADISPVLTAQGLGQPIQADELGAGFTNGSDSTYYLLMEQITTNELGAFVYVDREPFKINMHGPQTDAQLGKARKFEWLTEGRNVVGAGHPYLMIRCQAT